MWAGLLLVTLCPSLVRCPLFGSGWSASSMLLVLVLLELFGMAHGADTSAASFVVGPSFFERLRR